MFIGKGCKQGGVNIQAAESPCHEAPSHLEEADNRDLYGVAANADASSEECSSSPKRSISSREAEKRLHQLCAAFWSDSDNDADSLPGLYDSAALSYHTETNSCSSNQSSEVTIPEISNSRGNLGRIKRVSKGGTSEGKEVLPRISRPSKLCSPLHNRLKRERHNQLNSQLPKHSKKAQGLGKWESFILRRPRKSEDQSGFDGGGGNAEDMLQEKRKQTEDRVVSASLEKIRRLGGIGSDDHSAHLGQESATTQAGAVQINRDQEIKQDQKRIFDETVQDIRKMGSFKGQKMPLPEFRHRAASTSSALRARKAEERELGVKLFKDTAGGEARARSLRKKEVKAKERRAHLRQTFKDAGKMPHRRTTPSKRRKKVLNPT